MRRWIAALGICAALSALPAGAFAHGYDAGDAALIGSGAAPVYGAPAKPRAIYYRGGHRGWQRHGRHGHHPTSRNNGTQMRQNWIGSYIVNSPNNRCHLNGIGAMICH
jgi:PAB1-binding protein PBP1